MAYDGRPMQSTRMPFWPWRAVVTSDRIEVRRPFRPAEIVPLGGVASIVVTLFQQDGGLFGQGAERLTLRDRDGGLICEVSEGSFTPDFLAALTRFTGCEVEFEDGGGRPYGGGGPS